MSYTIAIRNLRAAMALAKEYRAVHWVFLEDDMAEAEASLYDAERLAREVRSLAAWHAQQTVQTLLPSDAFPEGQPEVAKNHARIAQKLFVAELSMDDHLLLLSTETP